MVYIFIVFILAQSDKFAPEQKTEYLKIIGDTLTEEIHEDAKVSMKTVALLESYTIYRMLFTNNNPLQQRKQKTIRTQKNFQSAKSNDIENRRKAVYNDS